MPHHGESDPRYRPLNPIEIRKYCARCKKWHKIKINYQSKDRCPRCGIFI